MRQSNLLLHFLSMVKFVQLKIVFSRLDHPDKLVNSTITRFIADKASDQPPSRLPAATNMHDPVRLVLPFKDQGPVVQSPIKLILG